MKRKLFVSVLAAAVLAIAVSCLIYFGQERVVWPEFPQAKDATPTLIVSVEPDFGYRTGDLIPVTVFIRQSPQTEVDVSSMALEGDFEIKGDPDVTTYDAPDGFRYVRVKLVLQSFAFRPAQSARVSMTWSVQGSKETQEVPRTVIEVHTSRTWDGREALQEGPQPFIQDNHLAVTLSYLVAGLLAIILLSIYIRRVRAGLPVKPVPAAVLSPRLKAKAEFDAVWALIEGGDHSAANFAKIDEIVRDFLRIPTVLLKDVPLAVGDMHPHITQIMTILTLCEGVMYQANTVSDEELQLLKKSFDDFILRR